MWKPHAEGGAAPFAIAPRPDVTAVLLDDLAADVQSEALATFDRALTTAVLVMFDATAERANTSSQDAALIAHAE